MATVKASCLVGSKHVNDTSVLATADNISNFSDILLLKSHNCYADKYLSSLKTNSVPGINTYLHRVLTNV
jgi:hypothetical protein